MVPIERCLIVDAMNVIGSRPTGWWRDRDGAARNLIARLQRLAAAERIEVVAVLDGPALPDVPEGEHAGIRVLYGERGRRNAADDRIVAVVEHSSLAAAVQVITSDRDLAARVRRHGVDVRGARSLLNRLDALGIAD